MSSIAGRSSKGAASRTLLGGTGGAALGGPRLRPGRQRAGPASSAATAPVRSAACFCGAATAPPSARRRTSPPPGQLDRDPGQHRWTRQCQPTTRVAAGRCLRRHPRPGLQQGEGDRVDQRGPAEPGRLAPWPRQPRDRPASAPPRLRASTVTAVPIGRRATARFPRGRQHDNRVRADQVLSAGRPRPPGARDHGEITVWPPRPGGSPNHSVPPSAPGAARRRHDPVASR